MSYLSSGIKSLVTKTWQATNDNIDAKDLKIPKAQQAQQIIVQPNLVKHERPEIQSPTKNRRFTLQKEILKEESKEVE